MKELIINGQKYLVKKNERDALENAELEEKITDYYNEFDYIVGDWAYGKLRLKGLITRKIRTIKRLMM